MMNTKTEVLIVGAGPTGLMAAAQLLRWGIRPRIIEANSGPSTTTKAVVLHARSAEIYQQMGLSEPVLAKGARVEAVNVFGQNSRIGRLRLGDIGKGLSPFPFLLTFGQDRNERVLGEFLGSHGLTVEWNTRLEKFGYTTDGVQITLNNQGQHETIQVRYLLAADGAHSTVRHLMKVAFAGDTFARRFFVADVQAEGVMVEGEVNIFPANRDYLLALFAMPGAHRYRALGDLPAPLQEVENPTFDDVRPYLEQAFGSRVRFNDLYWFSTYRVHHRVAQQFSVGNVFLLGDAAHVHSPVGGQGMNTGLQDAYNLVWKLVLVLQGEAEERLLETYHDERHINAKRMVETIDGIFNLIVTDNWQSRIVRFWLLPRLFPQLIRLKAFQRFAFRTVSQTGLHYKDGRLSANSLVSRVKAGERFPWFVYNGTDVYTLMTGTRFTLFALGRWERQHRQIEALRSHRLEPIFFPHRSAYARTGLEDGLYLVRPDGYIGLCTDRVEDVQRYLKETMGMPLTDASSPRLQVTSPWQASPL